MRPDIDLRAFAGYRLCEHIVLENSDMKAVNTEENPEEVSPRRQPVTMEDGCILLPAASWNVIRFATNEE